MEQEKTPQLKAQQFHKNIQTLEYLVYLQNGDQKFKPSDVTEFLGQVHMNLKAEGGTPLSLTVLSGYESAMDKDKPIVSNVAVIRGAYVLQTPSDPIPDEVHYYQAKLAEKFGAAYLVAPPSFSVVVGVVYAPN